MRCETAPCAVNQTHSLSLLPLSLSLHRHPAGTGHGLGGTLPALPARAAADLGTSRAVWDAGDDAGDDTGHPDIVGEGMRQIVTGSNFEAVFILQDVISLVPRDSCCRKQISNT